MNAWYALNSKPNAEYQVAKALQQREIEAYLPEIEATGPDKHRGKKPFFPCYLFCRIDLETVGLRKIKWIPGLRHIVAFGDQPVPVANEVIDLIRYKLGEIETGQDYPNQTFRPGDIVRITQGPFRDMLAIFDGPTSPSQRVQILLDILGGVSRIQIEINDLEKASGPAEASKSDRPRRTRGRGRPIKRGDRPTS